MKIWLIILQFTISGLCYAEGTSQALSKESAKNTMAKNSQARVTTTAEVTRDIVNDYRDVLRKIENAKVYNHQMKELITSQTEETTKIKQSIVDLKQTNKEIIPFTLRLLENFKSFVALDVPFQIEERTKRVETLTALMNKGNVSTSEKFRRVLEAYQIENDYGRSMETYKGLHKIGDKEFTVDFLRVGRIFLGLQSIDGSYSAYWDKDSKSWKEADGSYEKSIASGIKIAQKVKAPDLLKLPVSSPILAKAVSASEVK